MRKSLAAVLALTSLLAGACAKSAEPTEITWQITNVYSDPNVPSAVPGKANMVFGDSTVTGYTGCAPFHGRVRFEPSAAEPTKVTFRDMNFDTATCDGSQRYFHDQLVTLLDGEFEVKRVHNELLLSKPNELDRPGVRLVAPR